MPGNAALVDGHGRRIDYLRISVTDRCDLRCTYCLPAHFKDFDAPAHWLTHDEMTRLVGLFTAMGVRKLRLTGGEPLTRGGLATLAGALAALPGVHDLSLSTNGTRLARHAADLRAAGVKRLNVSLDTLDAAAYARITGRDCLDDVLRGLHAARSAGFAPIKLNAVVQAGTPENDLDRLLAYSRAHGYILRLIEPMPVGSTGRRTMGVDLSVLGPRLADRHGLLPVLAGPGAAPSPYRGGAGTPARGVSRPRSRHLCGAGPARYWGDAGSPALGVITPMSQHFCDACNRVRLGADGTLYPCLGEHASVPLGALLRQGASDTRLAHAIVGAIAAKPERHDF